MKASEGHIGRVFVLRLEDGDVVPDCIERFAEEKNIIVGAGCPGWRHGSGQVVVGPRDSKEMPPEPMHLPVDGAHEVVGVRYIAPGQGTTSRCSHIHAALGRSGQTLTGCLRRGVTTWLVGEAIICEIADAHVARLLDQKSGFELMEI